MPVPNLLTKFSSPVILTAAARLQNRRWSTPPEFVIFCPQPAVLQHAKRRWRGRAVSGFFGESYLLQKTGGTIGVTGQFGVGAPVMGVLVEEMAVWGVTNFLLLGMAGGLQPSLRAGDVVLAETAVRDEGTSHHYLPPSDTVAADGELVRRLQAVFTQAGIPLQTGRTWTTDAPYRETQAELAHYAAQGVLTVEMETAALLAVAQHVGASAAAVLVVSDSLAGGEWVPALDTKVVDQQLIQALDTIIEAFKR